ncbi:MAG: polysaccharide biosynthesis C-terminal domain-containing protein [Bacteroidales bacterium]
MGIVQRDSFRITLIAYAGAAIGYLNKIFLFTNFLETEQVGLANLMVTISLIYAQVAAFGAGHIVIRFFPFFNEPKKQHHGFLFAVLAFSMAGFVLATLLFLLLQKPFALLYQESSPLLVEYAIYLIPLGLGTMLFHIFEAYLRSLFKNTVSSVTHELVLRGMVTVVIVLFALGGISFRHFVMLYVASYCMPAVILIGYAAFKGYLKIKPVWSPLIKRLGKIMLVYGLFTLFNNLSNFLFTSIDALMVAGMINLSAAGIYTTMVFVVSVMLIPYRSMVKVSAPLVADYWKKRAITEIQQLYRKAAAGNMVVGSIVFLLLWVNLDTLFYLMSPEYEAGRYVFLLLGAGKLFDMSSGLNAIILHTSKKYRYGIMFTVMMVLFAIIANYFFIPLWGMEGAAFASMLTLILFNTLRILFLKLHFHIQPFVRKQIWVPILLAAIMVLFGMIDPFGIIFLDVPLRSAIAAVLFLLPVWRLKISEDLNQWAESIAGKYFDFLIKPGR